MSDDRRLSDEQARRLWQRAADLQAEAARTLEERSKGLARREATDGDDTAGYSLSHVRQAAVEAGISSEFMDLAIQESDDTDGEEGRVVQRVLGEGPRWISASRVYDEAPEVIFASLQRVLPRLRLSLLDTRGEPLEGGWMHFELPSVAMQEADRVMVDLYHWADVRELHVRLTPVGDGHSEVTARAPLGYARKLGGWVTAGLAPVGGLLLAVLAGVVAGGVVGGLAVGPLVQALAPWLVGAGAFGAGTAGGVKGLRALTRAGWGRGEAALGRLLGMIATDARTGGAFQPTMPVSAPHPSRSLQPSPPRSNAGIRSPK